MRSLGDEEPGGAGRQSGVMSSMPAHLIEWFSIAEWMQVAGN
jgi:hypothetical protein